MPKSLAAVAKQNGGDLLSFDDDIDRLIFELDYSYVLEDIDTKTVDGAMVEAYSGLQSLVNDVSDLAFLGPPTGWLCHSEPQSETPLGLQWINICRNALKGVLVWG